MRWIHDYRRRKAMKWVAGFAAHTQARIDGGDLDFDDWVYRGNEAANTLLEICNNNTKGDNA